jgi:hypothetical protein
VVHGDTVGAETLRRMLVDWAADMHMIPAGAWAEVDGYIGYFEPYATSHQALDKDHAFQIEARNAATALCEAVIARRAGRMVEPGDSLTQPRPK